MAIRIPRAVARFNERLGNAVQGHWAWILPPYAIVVHHGRRTGRRFSTPVVAFRAGELIVVPILYGRDSQWVLNLEAGGAAELVRGGRRYALAEPRVVEQPPGELGLLGRLATRPAAHLLVARVGARAPGGLRDAFALRPRRRRRGS
ncbi:MAG TPA: nitroreductase family deazaflavin-dependent oxidoreductase [Solirubrobacteraceae bacterium]|jgi:deazaflavin-dependent oxidoreductase (nitroreductase family)|nr:nitroreductase family deazaflavin-dependent oxidoreductase [Solirubrobacteraceae bacterium]